MTNPLTNLILSLALSLGACAQKWPTIFQPTEAMGSIKKIESSDQIFRYETHTYRIESEVELEEALLSNFAASAESVVVVIKSIPLPLFSPLKNKKPLIQISSSEESYEAAGGAKGTAGFYNARSKSVIIQWGQLNHRPASTRLLPLPAFDLLVHEICHLCMHRSLWKMEPWLTEGVAEYLTAAHLKEGRFDFTRIENHIRDQIRNRVSKEDKKITVMKMEKLLRLTSRDWLQRTATLPPGEALQSYFSALLLTHFTFHGGADRRTQIARYLEKLEKVTFLKDPRPILYTPVEGKAIEEKIKSFWSSRGLQLDFQ
jgi:hypothetical protein